MQSQGPEPGLLKWSLGQFLWVSCLSAQRTNKTAWEPVSQRSPLPVFPLDQLYGQALSLHSFVFVPSFLSDRSPCSPGWPTLSLHYGLQVLRLQVCQSLLKEKTKQHNVPWHMSDAWSNQVKVLGCRRLPPELLPSPYWHRSTSSRICSSGGPRSNQTSHSPSNPCRRF